MTAISRVVADKLWDVCNWAHETWILYRTLFDENPTLQTLANGRHAYFLKSLHSVLQEYALLQISKLHDPAVMSGRINLSLAYILEFGGWDKDTAARLRSLKDRLDELHVKIRPARNRITSHNDLVTLLEDAPVGEFQKDADVEYFRTLHDFVNCVFEQVTGTICAEFSTFPRADAEAAIRALVKSDRTRRSE
jgi:hypothetical protein